MKAKPGRNAKPKKPRPKLRPKPSRQPAKKPGPKPGPRTPGVEDTSHATSRVEVGANYTADEFEFLKAVEAWKKQTRRQYPACVDYLRIAMGLGYAKGTTTTTRGG